jgi:hypothetical protein
MSKELTTGAKPAETAAAISPAAEATLDANNQTEGGESSTHTQTNQGAKPARGASRSQPKTLLEAVRRGANLASTTKTRGRTDANSPTAKADAPAAAPGPAGNGDADTEPNPDAGADQAPDGAEQDAETRADNEPAAEDETKAAELEPANEETPHADPNAQAETDANAAKDSDGDVPFHNHPRWKQLLASEHAAKARVNELEPDAQVTGQIREAVGGDDGLRNAVELITTFATNPEAAVPMLEKLLGDAKQRAGLELTSEDLREDVGKRRAGPETGGGD